MSNGARQWSYDDGELLLSPVSIIVCSHGFWMCLLRREWIDSLATASLATSGFPACKFRQLDAPMSFTLTEKYRLQPEAERT